MPTKITYNGKTTELADGHIATLPCKDLRMETDVVIEAPEAAEVADSPLPIEVSTEAEMTALLTSGEVGGVYKYTGATGTYENGALYVLEEAPATVPVTMSPAASYSAVANVIYDDVTYEGEDRETFEALRGSKLYICNTTGSWTIYVYVNGESVGEAWVGGLEEAYEFTIPMDATSISIQTGGDVHITYTT